MKQIIDLGEHIITIEKKYKVKTSVQYSPRELDRDGCPKMVLYSERIPNPNTLEYGIYIALSDKTIIKPSDYKKGMPAEGVLIHTTHASIVISKLDHPETVTHDEAVKIGTFNRHEAIEYDINKKEVSRALVMIGGNPLKDEWYWLQEATEYSAYLAWLYTGSSGILNNNYKNLSFNVRPVTALKDFLSSF